MHASTTCRLCYCLSPIRITRPNFPHILFHAFPALLDGRYFPKKNGSSYQERFPLEEFILNGQKIVDLVTKAPQTVVFNKLDRLQSYADHLQLHVSLLQAYFSQRAASEAALRRVWVGFLVLLLVAAASGVVRASLTTSGAAMAILVACLALQGISPPVHATYRENRMENTLRALADVVTPLLQQTEGCALLTPPYSLERVLPYTLAAAVALETAGASANSYAVALESLVRLRMHVVGVRPSLAELRRMVQDSMGVTPPDSFREKTVYF